jgi:hypothetical protein
MEPASYERYVRRASITRLRAENCRTAVAMRVQQRPASCNGERYGLGGAAGTEEIAEQSRTFACADAAINLELMIEAPVAAEVED